MPTLFALAASHSCSPQTGDLFKDLIIPDAVALFTGETKVEEEEDDEEEDDEAGENNENKDEGGQCPMLENSEEPGEQPLKMGAAVAHRVLALRSIQVCPLRGVLAESAAQIFFFFSIKSSFHIYPHI